MQNTENWDIKFYTERQESSLEALQDNEELKKWSSISLTILKGLFLSGIRRPLTSWCTGRERDGVVSKSHETLDLVRPPAAIEGDRLWESTGEGGDSVVSDGAIGGVWRLPCQQNARETGGHDRSDRRSISRN